MQASFIGKHHSIPYCLLQQKLCIPCPTVEYNYNIRVWKSPEHISTLFLPIHQKVCNFLDGFVYSTKKLSNEECDNASLQLPHTEKMLPLQPVKLYFSYLYKKSDYQKKTAVDFLVLARIISLCNPMPLSLTIRSLRLTKTLSNLSLYIIQINIHKNKLNV